jgi:hypothetical protein
MASFHIEFSKMAFFINGIFPSDLFVDANLLETPFSNRKVPPVFEQ